MPTWCNAFETLDQCIALPEDLHCLVHHNIEVLDGHPVVVIPDKVTDDIPVPGVDSIVEI